MCTWTNSEGRGIRFIIVRHGGKVEFGRSDICQRVLYAPEMTTVVQTTVWNILRCCAAGDYSSGDVMERRECRQAVQHVWLDGLPFYHGLMRSLEVPADIHWLIGTGWYLIGLTSCTASGVSGKNDAVHQTDAPA
jgi:hypothetical protein